MQVLKRVLIVHFLTLIVAFLLFFSSRPALAQPPFFPTLPSIRYFCVDPLWEICGPHPPPGQTYFSYNSLDDCIKNCRCPCGKTCKIVHLRCSNGDVEECTCNPCPTSTSRPTETPTEPPQPTSTSTPIPTSTATPTATPTPIFTPTPTSTSTPIPTSTLTPMPTSTPTATPIPTATPTPREPPATCACWELTADHPDLSRVKKGDLLNFTGESYVSTPQTAKVLDMVFALYHEITSSKTECGQDPACSNKCICEGSRCYEMVGCTNLYDNSLCSGCSGVIPAYFNRSEIIGGVNTDVYRSGWSWQVPTSGDVEGLYYLKLIIHCGWKEGGFQGNPLAFRVLGETQPEKRGFSFGALIQRILDFLGLGGEEAARIRAEPTPTPKVPFQPPFPTVFRPEGSSLQLGTFLPVPTLPAGGCTDLYFQVPGSQ